MSPGRHEYHILACNGNSLVVEENTAKLANQGRIKNTTKGDWQISIWWSKPNNMLNEMSWIYSRNRRQVFLQCLTRRKWYCSKIPFFFTRKKKKLHCFILRICLAVQKAFLDWAAWIRSQDGLTGLSTAMPDERSDVTAIPVGTRIRWLMKSESSWAGIVRLLFDYQCECVGGFRRSSSYSFTLERESSNNVFFYGVRWTKWPCCKI